MGEVGLGWVGLDRVTQNGPMDNSGPYCLQTRENTDVVFPLARQSTSDQSLFQASFLGGGRGFPSKNLHLPQMAAKLCSKSFFSVGKMNYKYITKIFF